MISALRAAVTQMDNDEVSAEQRFLYITPLLKGYLDDMDTTKSREILQGFAKIVKVPQTRFYTAITQYDGTSENQTAGGYIKKTGTGAGKDINFMIIQKSAVIQFQKHIAPKIITPEQNQTADGYKFGYRNVGIAEAYENKVAGIYLHHKAS